MGSHHARNLRSFIPGAKLVTVPRGRHNDLFHRDGARLFGAIAALASASNPVAPPPGP